MVGCKVPNGPRDGPSRVGPDHVGGFHRAKTSVVGNVQILKRVFIRVQGQHGGRGAAQILAYRPGREYAVVGVGVHVYADNVSLVVGKGSVVYVGGQVERRRGKPVNAYAGRSVDKAKRRRLAVPPIDGVVARAVVDIVHLADQAITYVRFSQRTEGHGLQSAALPSVVLISAYPIRRVVQRIGISLRNGRGIVAFKKFEIVFLARFRGLRTAQLVPGAPINDLHVAAGRALHEDLAAAVYVANFNVGKVGEAGDAVRRGGIFANRDGPCRKVVSGRNGDGVSACGLKVESAVGQSGVSHLVLRRERCVVRRRFRSGKGKSDAFYLRIRRLAGDGKAVLSNFSKGRFVREKLQFQGAAATEYGDGGGRRGIRVVIKIGDNGNFAKRPHRKDAFKVDGVFQRSGGIHAVDPQAVPAGAFRFRPGQSVVCAAGEVGYRRSFGDGDGLRD